MTLLNHLSTIPDSRKETNKKHQLVDVVFLTFSAILSGASGWKSIQQFGDTQLDWLRQYRPFENGIPRRHCIANVIKSLDSELLLQCLMSWINLRREQAGKSVIAIDGKMMRRAWGEDIQKALHVVSAFDVENGIALYQEASSSKGHEAEVARHIIDSLACKDTIVTLDALHCQVDTMKQIRKKRGDFIIQLKGNQPKLLEQVKRDFAHRYDSDELAKYEHNNVGHGRKERRTVMQIDAKLPAELKKKWPQIKSLIEVASERTLKGKTSCCSRWYASSLPVDAEQAYKAIRDHWAVENNLHWVLDVVFREDELNVADPKSAKHLALFNRVALSVLKQHQGSEDSMAGKRRGAGWDPKFRSELIFG